MAELREIVAKNLTYLRTTAGLTQAELAGRLNYSDKSVSKWERGDGLPDVAVLVQLARMFDVSVDWLVTDHLKLQPPRVKNGMTRNQRLITEICLLAVLYTALVIFFGFWLSGEIVWIVLVAAVPVGAVVYLIFNSIWGRNHDNVYIISALLWTLIATFYLLLLERNVWLLFLLGVPAQGVIILAFHIRLPKWNR